MDALPEYDSDEELQEYASSACLTLHPLTLHTLEHIIDTDDLEEYVLHIAASTRADQNAIKEAVYEKRNHCLAKSDLHSRGLQFKYFLVEALLDSAKYASSSVNATAYAEQFSKKLSAWAERTTSLGPGQPSPDLQRNEVKRLTRDIAAMLIASPTYQPEGRQAPSLPEETEEGLPPSYERATFQVTGWNELGGLLRELKIAAGQRGLVVSDLWSLSNSLH